MHLALTERWSPTGMHVSDVLPGMNTGQPVRDTAEPCPGRLKSALRRSMPLIIALPADAATKKGRAGARPCASNIHIVPDVNVRLPVLCGRACTRLYNPAARGRRYDRAHLHEPLQD